MYFTYVDFYEEHKECGAYFCDGFVFLFEGGSGGVHVGNRLRDVIDLVIFPRVRCGRSALEFWNDEFATVVSKT